MGFKAFLQGLHTLGYVEGQNVVIEYRWAEGKENRLSECAAELVRLKVDVLFAASASAVRAAWHATRTIPIVAFDLETDPVASGMVASLAQPGGNLTGVFLDMPEFYGRILQLLLEAVPGLTQVAVLWEPTTDPVSLRAVEGVARALRVQLQVVEVRGPAYDVDSAIRTASRGGAGALMVLPSPAMALLERRIADLAVRSRLPAMSILRGFAEAGGLMSYGANFSELFGRATALMDKILKGAKPADLPIERPQTFELVINLKTAQALGLTLPPHLLVFANEVLR